MDRIWQAGVALLAAPFGIAIILMVVDAWRHWWVEGLTLCVMMAGVALFVFGYLILPNL